MNSQQRACVRRPLQHWLHQAERGEDSSFEFTASILPILVMILLISFATLVRASQMPAWSAASDCARAAIATLDEGLGRDQAQRAALASLAGNSINASAGQILITGAWEPNAPVTCRVSYDIDVSGIPMIGDLAGGIVPVQASVTLRVEPYKSRWD
jgi:hypothetical protein